MNSTVENKNEKSLPRKHKFIEHWHKVGLFMALYDVVVINVSYFAALLVRFDIKYSQIPKSYLYAYLYFIPIYTIISIGVFLYLKLYKSIWRFASFNELVQVFFANIVTSIVQMVGITFIFQRMPLSYYIWGSMLQFILMIAVRFSYRFVLLERNRIKRSQFGPEKNVMIIGAGHAGQMLIRDINHIREMNDRVVCIIDDNPNKWNRYIDGIPIVGGRDSILTNAEKYKIDKIYMAIPSASPEDKREILNICNETDCELRHLPSVYRIATDDISVAQTKSVKLEDLLGREPISQDMREVFSFIKGKTVLVTGGGGSIGSELCRQVAGHKPKKLIILDVYENNAYNIQLELKEKYPKLDLVVLIGSVRDSRKIYEVFEEYRPEIVYHAAAHKHVPLMEDSPCEAIKNNAIGTYKTAYSAMVHGCERFVLISTDKAVNPTNIMGASKRLCEMIIQAFDAKIKAGKANEIPQLFTHVGIENADKDGTGSVFKDIKTEFSAVRFGNVLGSDGSVVPVFKRQIEHGGPVTVTHPDIVRYFMTIPEAVSLVMLAGTYAKGGEIFVLDMGSPVKIDTLARNLIHLYGLTPDKDIKIEYSGLRPGEKLYEEKLMDEEGLKETDNEKIHIGNPIPFDTDEFLIKLEKLMKDSYKNKKNIKEEVADIVPTYMVVNNVRKISRGA